MIEKAFQIFGLEADSDLNTVKKVFRKLAKDNHPDRFTDKTQKKKQEEKMAEINSAYQKLLSDFDRRKNETKINNQTENPETDTSLYKKGVEYFNKYSGSISIKSPQYTHFDRETIETKRENLLNAQDFFRRVLEEYPESDWAYDSEERLKKIGKIFENLKERDFNTKPLHITRKDDDIYYNNLKNMFKEKHK